MNKPNGPAFAMRILLLLLLALPAVAQEQWSYTTNNAAIIITKYTGSGGAVTIPDKINDLPITKIGDEAFGHCIRLTSITIPNGVIVIGQFAFAGCSSLTNVTIDNRLTIDSRPTIIGDDAFMGCGLTSITIGSGVTSIGAGAFYNCTNLTRVTIPNSVTSIGGGTFAHCVSLTGVYFQGNAPHLLNSFVFASANKATVYYLPETTGWESKFGGRPTAVWKQ